MNDIKNEILSIIHTSGLYNLLMNCMVKSYKYESLECNLGNGCKITFEINIDDNKQLHVN
jgi:hypothetical protein